MVCVWVLEMCLLERQAGIRRVIPTMMIAVDLCVFFMVYVVFFRCLCTKISFLSMLSKGFRRLFC